MRRELWLVAAHFLDAPPVRRGAFAADRSPSPLHFAFISDAAWALGAFVNLRTRTAANHLMSFRNKYQQAMVLRDATLRVPVRLRSIVCQASDALATAFPSFCDGSELTVGCHAIVYYL